MKLIALPLIVCPFASALADSGDWPQWRGVGRNGIAQSGKLADAWGENGPAKLWSSADKIPSNDDGGHGSAIVADGKVYMSVVWHTDVPTETRTVDNLVVRKLGGQHSNMPRKMVTKVEEARMKLSPRLRGKKLEEWAEKWLTENLTPEEKLNYEWWVTGRFKKGKSAIHVDHLDKVLKAKDREFPSADAFDKWVQALDVPDEVKERVIVAVPNTKKVAQDVVICVDAASGKTLWKSAFDGQATGRGSSSTPCISGGKLYAIGSREVFCVDVGHGDVLWRTPVKAKGAGSSPLVAHGLVVVNADRLAAVDAATGDKKWELQKHGSKNGSPVLWEGGGRPVVICNTKKELVGVDLKSGEVLWTVDGGGDSTPVVDGDLLVVYAKGKPHKLLAYKLAEAGTTPKLVWKIEKMVRRAAASPIIYKDHVYLLGGDSHMCIEAASGKVKWDEKRNSSISSPVLADGKLFVLENRGSQIVMIKADPSDYSELGRAKVQTMHCPSPTVAGDQLILRMKNGLTCFDLREPKKTP